MRSVINTIANVTTNAIANRTVRTVMAGVDASAPSLRHQRLYAAPAPQHWDHADGDKPFAGKQKPAGTATQAGTGSSLGGSELSRCTRRDTSRCRRPRVSSWLARS